MKDLKLIPIHKDITQEEFPNEIKKKGWECLKLIRKNYKKITEIINKSQRDVWNSTNIKHMNSLGKPDFFIYKKDRFYFCEFKSKNDSLRNEQFIWMADHIDYPKALAFVTLKKRRVCKLNYTDKTISDAVEEFIERNTKKILDEYQLKSSYFERDAEYEFFREIVEKKLKVLIESGNFILDVPNKEFLSLNFDKYLYFYYK